MDTMKTSIKSLILICVIKLGKKSTCPLFNKLYILNLSDKILNSFNDFEKIIVES